MEFTGINYADLARQFGTVAHEGNVYWLTQHPDYSNRPFGGWWGDAQEGESYTAEFEADAVDGAGDVYRVRWQFEVVKGEEPELDSLDWDEIADVTLVEMAEDDDDGPSLYTIAYNHPALRQFVPSEKSPHLDALQATGLLDALTPDQTAEIVRLMQTAYRNGQRAQGAERIDNDAVWLDGVGGLERQPDGTWRLTMPDEQGRSAAAAAMGSVSSPAKTAAVRENGKKGGRPRKRS